MDTRLRSTNFTLNQLSFSALSAGPQDGPLVLMLHGFPQFADAWASVMPALAARGFHAVALDQRGYSVGARPLEIASYAASHLTSDVLALADTLGAQRFHLVGHDWGGFLAWKLAAEHPDRLRSVSVLSTPHGDAFSEAVASDADQQARSQYIQLFRLPGHVAENVLLADHAKLLRGAYQGTLSEAQLESNLARLSVPGALTAALNWYRALKAGDRLGKIHVPSLYIWGDQDLALGKSAAYATAQYIDAPYTFKELPTYSHWLLEEAPETVTDLVLKHITAAESAA